VAVRGRTLFFALVAALSLLGATAVAAGHRVVVGTKSGDELTMGDAGNRVFARGGDDTVDGGGGNDKLRGGRGDDVLSGEDGNDRLRGGQDSDVLDGGDGNDYLNGGGDGRDKDRIVCGDGHDVVVLGRNDVVLVEVDASEHPAEDGVRLQRDPVLLQPDPGTEPALDEPEPAHDDGCEKVKGPGAPEVCASHRSPCEGAGRPCVATARECGEDDRMPCASNYGGCEEPVQEPCVATVNRECDAPVAREPEPDSPVEAPEPDAGAE
jgi:RTX calcium-binding nonapeptide repeat (4 copies)